MLNGIGHDARPPQISRQAASWIAGGVPYCLFHAELLLLLKEEHICTILGEGHDLWEFLLVKVTRRISHSYTLLSRTH
jgi:hypothetical protein